MTYPNIIYYKYFFHIKLKTHSKDIIIYTNIQFILIKFEFIFDFTPILEDIIKDQENANSIKSFIFYLNEINSFFLLKIFII